VGSICPDTWWGSYPRSIDVTQKKEGEKCNDTYRYYTLTNQKRVRVDENSVARYQTDPQATLANDVDLRQQIKPVHPRNCADTTLQRKKVLNWAVRGATWAKAPHLPKLISFPSFPDRGAHCSKKLHKSDSSG
jgi:hypothetical protein